MFNRLFFGSLAAYAPPPLLNVWIQKLFGRFSACQKIAKIGDRKPILEEIRKPAV